MPNFDSRGRENSVEFCHNKPNGFWLTVARLRLGVDLQNTRFCVCNSMPILSDYFIVVSVPTDSTWCCVFVTFRVKY